MKINNKTILITGVVILGALGSLTGYQEALIASISGLVGYLAKDMKTSDDNDTET